MYKTNLAEKVGHENEDLFKEEKGLMRKFRGAYERGNFDEAMECALELDNKLYEQGIDLLDLSMEEDQKYHEIIHLANLRQEDVSNKTRLNAYGEIIDDNLEDENVPTRNIEEILRNAPRINFEKLKYGLEKSAKYGK